MTEPRVGRAAYLLGLAGLLPQIAAVGMIAGARIGDLDLQLPIGIAIIYPLAILSFLGGIWWGFAMRRDAGQARLAVLAVLPSLVAIGLFGVMLVTQQIGWSLVAIGSAVILTLPVDRHLASTGEAPRGWMRLRIPLSTILGALTILAGTLIGGSVTYA